MKYRFEYGVVNPVSNVIMDCVIEVGEADYQEEKESLEALQDEGGIVQLRIVPF